MSQDAIEQEPEVVLVVGATGGIGTALCARLARDRRRVFAVASDAPTYVRARRARRSASPGSVTATRTASSSAAARERRRADVRGGHAWRGPSARFRAKGCRRRQIPSVGSSLVIDGHIRLATGTR